MSESSSDTRNWRLYVQDMIEFAERTLSYTEGMNKDGFINNKLTYDATLRNIQLIGEAATHVPAGVCASNPEIDWRSIVATRNRLVHAYLGIDDDVIWDIIQTNVPRLLPELRMLLEST